MGCLGCLKVTLIIVGLFLGAIVTWFVVSSRNQPPVVLDPVVIPANPSMMFPGKSQTVMVEGEMVTNLLGPSISAPFKGKMDWFTEKSASKEFWHIERGYSFLWGLLHLEDEILELTTTALANVTVYAFNIHLAGSTTPCVGLYGDNQYEIVYLINNATVTTNATGWVEHPHARRDDPRQRGKKFTKIYQQQHFPPDKSQYMRSMQTVFLEEGLISFYSIDIWIITQDKAGTGTWAMAVKEHLPLDPHAFDIPASCNPNGHDGHAEL